MSSSSRIVLWCDGGGNQKALAHKLAARFGLAGVVVEKRVNRRRFGKRTARRIVERALFGKVDASWMRLLSRYEELFPDFPDVEMRVVDNINSVEARALVERTGAELVLVSGTRLVREPLLSMPLGKGILNLHTGLSPYVKGGPNCTNWCLSEGTYHLIGNTVMWIDAGIDSGNLVTTDFVPLTGDEDLSAIHWKVMEHAHELYLDSVGLLLSNPEACPSIAQATLGEGTTYFTRAWGWRERRRLLKNMNEGRYRDTVTSARFTELRKQVTVHPLPTAGLEHALPRTRRSG